MTDYLCEELIAEIFGRLPPKSLLRFRCLSKSWCSRIVSPDFIRMHARLSPQKILIKHSPFFFGNRNWGDFCTLHYEDRLPLSPTPGYMGITPIKFPECSPMTKFPGYSSDVIGSCNGVLCLFNGFSITLWNPSVHRKLDVPHNSILEGCSTSSWLAVGFGFDPITDDYKIVAIYTSQNTGVVLKSLVYTTKTGTWCSIISPTTPFFDVFTWGCFVNGALHWVVKESMNHCYIMTFDLNTQVFGTIMLPEESRVSSRRLTTISGSLAVIFCVDDYSWIWVRKVSANVSSWSVVCKLEGGAVDGILQLTNCNFLVNTWHDGFLVYNPVTGVRSRLMELEGFYMVKMETYVESLALMDIGTAWNPTQRPCIS